MTTPANSQTNTPPCHVAIIMDGNGRWANERGLPRVEGHRVGAQTVRKVVEEAVKQGIRYLTLFTFSTENWRRPATEVATLMKMFAYYLGHEAEDLRKQGVRLRVIGERERLSPELQKAIIDAETHTAAADRMQLVLAVSYGGQEEIVQATRKLAEQVAAGTLAPEAITADHLAGALYAPDIPEVDLMIRTSQEVRISNFLLWRLAYSEIVLSKVFWPDFSPEEFSRCLAEFKGRQRRFGMTGEQVASGSDNPPGLLQRTKAFFVGKKENHG